MKGKGLAIGVVAIGILVVFAIGGYMLGSKSNVKRVEPEGGFTTPGGTAAANQPINHAALIEDLKARIKEKPDDFAMLQSLGDTYFDSKQFSEAITYYNRAIKLKPDDADIYNDLGLSMHYLGNSAEGLKYVEEGIKRNPYQQRVWLTKGFILAYGMGDLDAARAAWEKARVINPESQVGKAASDFLAQFDKK